MPGWATGRYTRPVPQHPDVARCRTPTDRVQAHHLHALADGGPADGPGVALCFAHHLLMTRVERARRKLR
jgi:hypothetical protein